ncbi:lipopolysaccharide biosynthesis protein [Arthrobacter sp. Sr33]|uniref:lipopolysaccharide biosynthesis protein n=1 Tax=Arthrobacter sp. TB 23 TaxID=494419 RepID=UPI000308C3BC|nr:lipopolysaccharide biosynthesis protein [Arthrobacter sp. TB 23]
MKLQFLVMLATRVFASGVQAVSVVLLARWVGIETFGLIAVVLGIGGVLFTVSDWGLSSYIPRARAKGDHGDVATGLRMSCGGNLIAGILFALAILVIGLSTGASSWLCLLPIALALDQFTEAGLTVPVADKLKRPIIVSVLLRRCAALAIFVGLFMVDVDPLAAYTLGMLISGLLGLAHILVVLRSRMRGIRERSPFRVLYRSLTPYMVANLSAASRSLDAAIVAGTTSVASAGLYSAAFRITRPLMLVGSAAVAVILPHAARESLATVKRLGWQLSAAAGLSVIPLAVVAYFAEPIVILLFGAPYADAAPAFALAVLAIPFLSLAPPLGGMLQAQGYQNFVARNGVIFAAVTLASVWVGAVYWEATGAAGGILVAYVLKVVALLVRLLTAKPVSPATGARSSADPDLPLVSAAEVAGIGRTTHDAVPGRQG